MSGDMSRDKEMCGLSQRQESCKMIQVVDSNQRKGGEWMCIQERGSLTDWAQVESRLLRMSADG
ncbi:uncharacterized, partial [Tachysurus ichikawai]